MHLYRIQSSILSIQNSVFYIIYIKSSFLHTSTQDPVFYKNLVLLYSTFFFSCIYRIYIQFFFFGCIYRIYIHLFFLGCIYRSLIKLFFYIIFLQNIQGIYIVRALLQNHLFFYRENQILLMYSSSLSE